MTNEVVFDPGQGGGGSGTILSGASTGGTGSDTGVVAGAYRGASSILVSIQVDLTTIGPIMEEYMPELANLLAMDF